LFCFFEMEFHYVLRLVSNSQAPVIHPIQPPEWLGLRHVPPCLATVLQVPVCDLLAARQHIKARAHRGTKPCASRSREQKRTGWASIPKSSFRAHSSDFPLGPTSFLFFSHNTEASHLLGRHCTT
jgi:hypothetical protein